MLELARREHGVDDVDVSLCVERETGDEVRRVAARTRVKHFDRR